MVFKVQTQSGASTVLDTDTMNITIEHGASKLHTTKKSTVALEGLTLGQRTIDESQTEKLQKLTHKETEKEISLSYQSTPTDNLQNAQRNTHVFGVSILVNKTYR